LGFGLHDVLEVTAIGLKKSNATPTLRLDTFRKSKPHELRVERELKLFLKYVELAFVTQLHARAPCAHDQYLLVEMITHGSASISAR